MVEILRNLQEDRKKVFNIIQKRGPLSKQDILLITNLKLTTLNRIINDLEFAELIAEDSLGESTGGRKPVLYDVNTFKFYIIGVDISRTYAQIVFTNLKMQILKENRIAIDEHSNSEKVLEHIIHIISDMLIELHVDKNQVLGIGVGTIGPLDREKGILLNPVNFNEDTWLNVSIKEKLENKLNLQVLIDNGANSAALGEYFYGIGKGYENIAYINCGVGIRTGVINDGKIIRTINDREDAFGHMVIDIDGEPCYCGNYGCLESYSSIFSILNKFKREVKKGKISTIKKNLDEINYLDIFMAAEKGDIVAGEIVNNAAIIFGAALANYINLLNPQLIILSGPTVYSSETFYKVSTDAALKRINAINVNIKFSMGGYFKEYAMALGAAAMVLEKYLSKN